MVMVYTDFQLEAGVAVATCSQNCSSGIAGRGADGGSILAQGGEQSGADTGNPPSRALGLFFPRNSEFPTNTMNRDAAGWSLEVDLGA